MKRLISRKERERRELWARICEQRQRNAVNEHHQRLQAEVEKAARLRELRMAKAKAD